MSYDGTLRFDTSLNSAGFQKGANSLTSFVKGLGAFELLKKGLTMVTDSVGAAASRLDTLNKYPKVMQSMGYTAIEAEQSMDKLNKGIQGLPTSLDGIVASTQNIAVLTGDLNLATDTALALNDAFLASGASSADAERGLTQYVQMLSKGEPDMQSWRTLQETMGYALTKTAEAFGFAGSAAQNDLYAALQEGTITFSDFNQKLIELDSGVGGFAEMAQTSSGGIATAWTNAKTAIVRGTANIVNSIDKGLSKTRFKSIEGVIKSFGKGFEKVLKGVAKVTETAINIIAKYGDVLKIAAAGMVAYKAITITTTAVQNIFGKSMKTAAAAIQLLNAKEAVAADLTGMLTVKEAALAAVKGIFVKNVGLATSAQLLWNAAMAANPVMTVVVAITALVGGMALLLNVLEQSDPLLVKANESLEAAAERTKELNSAMAESQETFEKNKGDIEATSSVADGYIDRLEELGGVVPETAAEQKEWHEILTKLKTTVPGVSDLIDENTGEIKGGTEALRNYVDEWVKAAKIKVYAQRLEEATEELVDAEENLARIEKERQDIIDELTDEQKKQYDTYVAAVEEAKKITGMATDDVYDLKDALDRMQLSGDVSAETVDRLGSAFFDADRTVFDLGGTLGEFNGQIADAQETVNASQETVDTTTTKMHELGGAYSDAGDAAQTSADKQAEAMEELQDSVSEKTGNVINSFKKIPKEFDMSADEMLESLQANKELYAKWESNMEEITRQLGPTAAEEFKKLGPEANSAIEEILESPEKLEAYRETLGVKIDEATGAAVENWNDPDFIGAPAEAAQASAEQIKADTSLQDATVENVQQTVQAAEEAVEQADFSGIGEKIAQDMAGADYSPITEAVSKSISQGAGGVTKACQGLQDGMAKVFQQTSVRAKTCTDTMMKNISSSISGKRSGVISLVTSMSTGIVSAISGMPTRFYSIGYQSMAGMYKAMTDSAPKVYAKARSIADTVAETMADALEVHSPSRKMEWIFKNVMLGIYNPMEEAEGPLSKKALEIASSIENALAIDPQVFRLSTQLQSAAMAGALPAYYAAGGGGTPGGSVINNYYSYEMEQTNISPEALTTSEIDRQTKRMLKQAARWQTA